MAAIDIGDPLPNLAVLVEDPPGTPVDVGAMALTITLPDGTTASVTPSRTDVGTWEAEYVATMGGLHVCRWVATGANACVKVQYRSVGDPVDIDEVRVGLKVGGTASDDILYQLIAAAVNEVERKSGRALRKRSVTDIRAGGKYAVALSQVPVASVTSVTEDGTALAASDYELQPRTGLLYRGSASSPGMWSGGPTGVRVTYVVDADAVPANLRQAALELTRALAGRYRGSSGQPSAGDVADAYELVRQLVGPRIPRF